MRKPTIALAAALLAATLHAACTSPPSRVPPRCGDGKPDAGEACDDGNQVETDGCTSRCALPTCGDGAVQGQEGCDDGNAVNTDACLATCVAASCGDRFVHQGVEDCDPSVEGGDPTCRSDCTRYRCGDGEIRAGEQCDDANTAAGDGCGATCQVENGFCCIAGVGCVQTGAQPDGAAGSTPAKNVCLECRPGSSQTAWTAVSGPCDDGAFCTGTDTCQAGACVHAGSPCANPAPYCDEARDACFACLTPGHCDDGNPCTDDVCSGGSCTHTNNTAGCDDGLWCNGADTCAGGSCSAHAGRTCGGQTPQCSETADACVACLIDAHCDDGEVCTTDTCDGGTCVHAANALGCDDGIFCNGADTCANKTCSVHPGQPCSGATPYCNEAMDRCDQCTEIVPCPQDGVYCNGLEICSAGICGHTGSPCSGTTPYCVEDTDACELCTGSSHCADGNVATTDVCSGGACSHGTCAGGTYDCDGDPVSGCESTDPWCGLCRSDGDQCSSSDQCCSSFCDPRGSYCDQG